jgi:hypothetical protein
MSRRSIIALAVPILGLALEAAPAHAAVCGVPGSQTSRATLTLDDQSVTSVAYGRGTDPPRTLLLRFKAAGCTLPDNVSKVSIEVVPKQGMPEIPSGGVSLLRARVDDDEFSVRLSSDTAKFEPGTYAGFVEVRTPYTLTARTPVSLSRSESNPLWPILIGVIGGVIGLGWFWFLNKAKGATAQIKGMQYLIVFGAAAVAGIVAVLASYWDQEVWTLGANGKAAAFAAFTGATTGAMATALGVLWKEPAPAPGDASGGGGGAAAPEPEPVPVP